MKNETKAVSTRVTKLLAELIEGFCKRTYLNPADFIRDAIRDKCIEKLQSFTTNSYRRPKP